MFCFIIDFGVNEGCLIICCMMGIWEMSIFLEGGNCGLVMAEFVMYGV